MASKKKQQITIPIKTKDELLPFLASDYHKVVVLNVYDEFWGPCECVETLIKRFQENPINTGRVDFLNCKKEFVLDLIPPKIEFGAKPKYFIFIRGQVSSWIDGINFPRLMDELKKSYDKIDEQE